MISATALRDPKTPARDLQWRFRPRYFRDALGMRVAIEVTNGNRLWGNGQAIIDALSRFERSESPPSDFVSERGGR